MTVEPSRRDLILAAVSAAIASAGAAGFPATLFAQSAVTPQQFLTLSEKLTATPNLDIGIATTGGLLLILMLIVDLMVVAVVNQVFAF